MKRRHLNILSVVALAMCAVLLLPLGVRAEKKAKPKIEFATTRHDFGNVREAGGRLSTEFTFTNTGTGNLLIIDATATCGCTRPEYPKQPIPPGKSGKIKVTYNPVGRPGPIDRTVTVKTNGSPSKVRLKIVGTVIPTKR